MGSALLNFFATVSFFSCYHNTQDVLLYDHYLAHPNACILFADLDQITIQSSTHSITEDGRLGIPMGALETPTNYSISLACQVDSQQSSSNSSDKFDYLHIEWYFKGELVNSSYDHSYESHLGDVFSELTGHSLTLTSEDPWLLIGSIQCFASITSSVIGSRLGPVLSADIHVVAEGELCVLLSRRFFFFLLKIHPAIILSLSSVTTQSLL